MAGLVLAVLAPSVMSLAVTVRLPAVFRVTLKFFVPATNAALAGNVAFTSLEVIPTVSVIVLTRFQLASTALTVTVKGVPAVWAVGVPVLPVPVPGAAVSPGARSCSFVNAPAFTVIDGLVLAVFVPSVMSLAVTVRLPAVFRVTLNVLVPATNAALAGNAAFTSLEVIPAVSVTVLTKFQLASTALTVTEKAAPAVRAVGAPVLPLAEPGAAVSPVTNNCNFTNAPALTVIAGLVLAVLVPSVISVAVAVQLPAVFKVTLKVRVPATSAALAGNVAFTSLEVMPTV